ncbi:MAG: cysteine desulfurase [Candidatus Diapherotrites archaeon]|uniref:Cysteine desulfurase n=1 Tax=Candidatus Iainarchaeum sp. TaxID=3101447 RepID=A0A8T3YLA3_9ARCH|nr:cysteine desulfurase [Candidatus Diapherotrites archaeon]
MDTARIRKGFPILARKLNGKKMTYLDNAATTQKPRQVIKAEREFYEKRNANVHRGLNALSREATELYELAHENAARFINAGGIEEIVFTKNATESLNLLAYSLGENIRTGDEILLTKMEHHANIVPWQELAKRKKATVKYADITEDGRLDIEDLNGKISPRTRIVSVTMASNILGTINDVEKISALAHEAGAKCVVDAAQAVPHTKVDVERIRCDFLAFSAHKMLGPTGLGILYGKSELLEEMPPFLTGGDMISTVTLEGAEWNKIPWKFEAGTPNIAGAAGFSAAIGYLEKTGMENIETHENKLLKAGLKRMAEIKGVEIYGPEKGPRTGIIPFNVDGVHPHDVSEVLDGNGVIIRAGNHCAQPLMREIGVEGIARASFYLYNNTEEIERLASSVEEAKKTFGV